MAGSPDPVAIYRQEVAELLAELEQTLLDLETAPDDHGLVDKAFRALHTIKGSGAMFGFTAVAGFTHHLETAFERFRGGAQPITPELVGLTLASLDHIHTLVEAPAAADAAKGEDILRRLGEVTGEVAAKVHVTGVPAAAKKPEGPQTWRIRFKLAPNAIACGTNPLLLLGELRELGTCTITALTEAVPPLDTIDPVACYLAWDVVLTTRQPRSAIDDVFIFVAGDAEIDIRPATGDEEGKRLGEILIERGDVTPGAVKAALDNQEPIGTLLVKGGETTPDKIASALAEQKHLQESGRAARADAPAASIRVQADRLDSLMDQVGELVIVQARLSQIAAASPDATLRSVAEEVERLIANLRDTTMGIRMLPIGTLFGRFRRVVRDLSQSLGKQVVLVTEGEETELDKTVIEHLNDPLVHLIRNAVDHGVETPEERAGSGKPAESQVRLSAVHSGAQVLITVADDGAGMNRAAIRRKAEERGLLQPGAEISDGELFAFIFHPGFSTAKTVSSVSGRGVGLDVVRQAVDALRGGIEVDSTPGQGARVTLKLPLTLAIIDGLLVRVGDGRYVLPLSAVEECVDLSAEQDARSVGRTLLNLRGDIVPFLRLREEFAVTTRPSLYQKVVVVSVGGRRVGLVVDHVIGQYQTVIKSLSRLVDDVEQFSGATILGDGSVALIVDIPHLIDRAQAREMQLKAS